MDNTDCGRMQGPTGTPGSPAVLTPGPWNTRQHVQDDALDQVHIGQAAYMQSPPLEPLLPDADIPNSTQARAYTHSLSSPSATPTLPLAASVAAQDMAEDKLPTITTTVSSSSGSVTPSALQDLLLELELQSANHQKPPAALAEDHSGETSFVMKLPRSGLTTWKPLVASRPQDVDRMAPKISLVENAASQDGPESPTDSSTALEIGASVLAHRPVPFLTSHCETAAVPLNEPELMPDGDSKHSPAIYAGLAGRETTDAPTSMQVSSTQSPAPPDVTISEAGAGEQQGILPDTADEGPGDDIIIPEDLGVPRASPSDDVVLLATDQNAACPPVVQEHSMESAFESAVIPSTILEPVPSDDPMSVRQEMPSEQLAPKTVGCTSNETPVSCAIAVSSMDSEQQTSLPSLEGPSSTTIPSAEEEMVEEGPDDAAIPISAAALDHISAPATFEADDDPRIDTSCDRPSSQEDSVVSRSCLQEATLVDLEHDFPDSGMPCSAASIPADVPMDRDGLNMEPPPASDDPYSEALPPMTTADDAAAHLHPPEAAVPTDIDTNDEPSSENAGDDSKLDLVSEDPAPLQEHGEDVPRADAAIVPPTRTEETAVEVPVVVSEDLLQLENVISSRLVDTLDDHADVPMPLDDVASAPPSQEMDMRLSEELVQSDDIGIALAGDVREPEGGPATASLSEFVDVPCPGLSTFHISEDPEPTDAPADIPDAGGSDAYSGANSNVCSPLESAALPSPQAGLDTDSLLDVDMADCFAALPNFGDGIPALEDFHAAMPMSDDIPDDVALLEYDLPPSSPPPSSSPPRVFSSPGPTSLETTPTSSPTLGCGDVDGPATPSPFPKGQLSGPDSRLLKRALEEEDSAAPAGTSHLPRLRERQTKRVKTEDVTPAHTPPNPTRPTPASQAKERKKLAAPFRSPVIKGPLVQGGLHAVYATGRAKVPPPPRKARAAEDDKASSSAGLPVKPEVPVANKDRTANVAKQFKSPLHASTVSCSVSDSAPATGTFSSVKAAPTIQALQGKVQTLKQAIKIKNSRNGDDEDDVLEGLVEKWTTAAREVAWGVWEYVKDLDPGCAADVGTKSGWFADDDGRAGPGTKRGLDSSWGYDDGHAVKRARMDDGADHADEKEKGNDEEEEEEPPVVHHTLGVMLRRMGIDPATLGWDEEEGDFVDVDA